MEQTLIKQTQDHQTSKLNLFKESVKKYLAMSLNEKIKHTIHLVSDPDHRFMLKKALYSTQLGDFCREIICHDINMPTQEEIAQEMKMNQPNVYRRLKKCYQTARMIIGLDK